MTQTEAFDKRVDCSLTQLVLYFLQLGTFGFGGPIALAGHMQRDLVEQRHWITKQEYMDGLAIAQLAPGPLAAQLAIYMGWVRGRFWGASLVSAAFILPSFLIVLVLSALYIRYGGIPWLRGAFYGIGAAVIAIMIKSVYKLCQMTLTKDWQLWSLFVLSASITILTESENVWIFLLCGFLTIGLKNRGFNKPGILMLAPIPWSVWLVGPPASTSLLWDICLYFAQAGAFVFGSGLAIVPFLYGGVVQNLHWLNEQQFLDAVAVAMITPGPVVITVAFIGYLVAGPLGALAAAIGVFLPCYLFVVILAPYYQKLSQNSHIKAFVLGVTASSTGAIAGAAFILGKRAILDLPTILIAIVAVLILFKFKKLPEPLLILVAGVMGVLIKQSTVGLM